MLQLLLHLIGDYMTQTDWMAKNKTKSSLAAGAHAIVYSVPFLIAPPVLNSFQEFLSSFTGRNYAPFDPCSIWAFSVILTTHFLIDRFRLARFMVFGKNKITNPSLKWSDCSTTGYHKDDPAWLTVWLLIVADNTLHLTINYFALSYL
jgi:hypothetical protein